MGATALIGRWWKLAAGLVLGALLCWPVASCDGRKVGREEMRAAFQRALADQAQRNAGAQGASADRQVADERAINQMEGDYRDAIQNTVDSAPNDAGRALGCERLRRAYPGAELPPACRPGR